MRVTIGYRMGLRPSKDLKAVPRHISDDPVCDERAPEFIQPENVIRLESCPSAPPVLHESVPERIDDGGPARVTGHMEFIHKTAPTLVIHGKTTISPEEYAAGRRR